MAQGTNAELEGRRIGFLGCGAMARALAGGLIEAGVPASQILGSDPFPGARDQFAEAIGAKTTEDNAEIVANSDVVLLAVKPGAVTGLLAALDDSLCDKPLWISIAAGVPLAALQNALPAGARVVRTMPNTPALVGAGSTAYYPAETVQDEEIGLVEAVLTAAGWCWRAPNEDLLDAVTGLSCSGGPRARALAAGAAAPSPARARTRRRRPPRARAARRRVGAAARVPS